MNKSIGLVLLATLPGCAKSGRAWLFDNSPYWDLLYEGARFHIVGFIAGVAVWWWLKDSHQFRGSWKPFLLGLASFSVFAMPGLYRGYQYINAPCTWEQLRTNDCPNYKLRQWPRDIR